MSKNDKWHSETIGIHGGSMRSQFDETSEAIFMNSGFIYSNAEEAEAAFSDEIDRYLYSRFGNPTVTIFEKKLALLEGAESCKATSSGMAAVFAALASFLKSGDRLVASKALFGSCYFICKEILPKYGVDICFVHGTSLNEWEKALSKPTKAIFLETPSNPNLEIIDITSIAKLAKKTKTKIFVDNVFSTPIIQKPLELGADVVIYSATKHIDGQGRCLGGAVLSSKEFIDDTITPFIRHTGPSLSPFNAWILLKGLETLNIRMQRHSENALKIANYLTNNKNVLKIIYPELPSHPQNNIARRQMKCGGGVVSFEIKGTKKNVFEFLNRLSLIKISNNLGDAKSLICHPATTTHQKLTEQEKSDIKITQNLLRLSVGLENINDLINDLDYALDS
jgi:O-succinylhomoserine sulfhydrylase